MKGYKMKRLLTSTALLTGIFFLTSAPVLLPIGSLSSVFPAITQLYTAIENAARRMIPDEIESIISAISDKLE